VKSGGGFIGGGFGAAGAVEGMAIAAVLNALTTQSGLLTREEFDRLKARPLADS
jgi:hypothetical protein